MKSNEFKQTIQLKYDRLFIGVSYILCFISAYLLLIYFEELSVYRTVLLGVFVFALSIISVKNILLKLTKRDWFIFFLVVLAIFTGILNKMYYGTLIFYTNNLFLIAAVIIGYSLNHLYIPKLSLFIFVFSILFGLLIFILEYELTHVDIPLYSRNLLSMVSIPILLVLFVQYQQNRFESPYVLMISTTLGLIVSIIAVGRSGIIASSIMFIAALIATTSYSKGKSYIDKLRTRFVFIFMAIVLMSVVLLFFFDYLQAKLSYLYVSGLTDPARSYIAQQYFELLTFSQIFSGTNYSEMPEFINFGGNLHNTYLTYHGNFGVFGIFIFLMFFYSIAKTAWNKEVFMTLVFLSFSLRILTDTGNDFFTHLGIFTIIFYGLKTKQTIQKNLNQSRTKFLSLKRM